jgi:zinc transporter ZupT
VRRTASGRRPIYWILGIALTVGLAAYVGGYLIKSSTTTELLGLVGDLLYTFGWALWTGVVVVVFLQIIPEIKRRQYQEVLDAYEASLHEEAGARSDKPRLSQTSGRSSR